MRILSDQPARREPLFRLAHKRGHTWAVLQWMPALHCLLVAAAGLDEASQRSTGGSTKHTAGNVDIQLLRSLWPQSESLLNASQLDSGVELAGADDRLACVRAALPQHRRHRRLHHRRQQLCGPVRRHAPLPPQAPRCARRDPPRPQRPLAQQRRRARHRPDLHGTLRPRSHAEAHRLLLVEYATLRDTS